MIFQPFLVRGKLYLSGKRKLVFSKFCKDQQDRALIEQAMGIIMYETGSPMGASTGRNPCIYFRPREPTDTTYLTIVHGTGCNAHVIN